MPFASYSTNFNSDQWKIHCRACTDGPVHMSTWLKPTLWEWRFKLLPVHAGPDTVTCEDSALILQQNISPHFTKKKITKNVISKTKLNFIIILDDELTYLFGAKPPPLNLIDFRITNWNYFPWSIILLYAKSHQNDFFFHLQQILSNLQLCLLILYNIMVTK